MPTIQMINVGDQIRLTSEWKPLLAWDKRNLVLFRNLKLTKKVPVKQYATYQYDAKGALVRDINGTPVMTNVMRNETVKNPLFRNDDGEYTPVLVEFATDTVVEISKFDSAYQGRIYDIWLKVLSSPDSRFTGRVVSVSMKQFDGLEYELVHDDNLDQGGVDDDEI